jgi:hypothetical protein
MRIQTTLLTGALTLLTGSGLWAQSAQQEFNRVIERLEGQTVTAKPYSATAVTTSTQTLADGTKINRTIEAQLARDSEGRTRREESLSSVGPWSTNAKGKIVFIKDPVALMQYTLQPDGQTAKKVSLAREPQRITPELEARRAAEDKMKQSVEAERKAKAEAAAREGRGNVITVSTERGFAYTVTTDSTQKAQVDDLGVKVIEGVTAKGRRETQTIPVGQIGNDRPISVVSETWYSDELQAIVLSRHSDPRVGDSEYKLTNVSRAEPSRSLFEVPAGYTVKEEGREPASYMFRRE